MRVFNHTAELYILKSFPFLPTLSGVSANTGPSESSFIAKLTIKITGEKITIKIEEQATSISLLANS